MGWSSIRDTLGQIPLCVVQREGRVEGIWQCLFAHPLHSAAQKSVVRTRVVFQIWVWKR